MLKDFPVGRRDLGIVAVVIIMSQLTSSLHSTQDVSSEIGKFKDEFRQSLLDRETYFVRKSDISSLASKIDQLNEHLLKLSQKVQFIQNDLKDYSYIDFKDEKMIPCSSPINTTHAKHSYSVL